VSHKAPSPFVEILTRIWQRVLQRSPIGVDENFFSIGGKAAVADALFAEIARECGRELPSATIYHAQTIAELACVLEQPTLPRFSPFVLMKPGDEMPPVIIVHGLAGSVQFFELARHMDVPNPIYGIQAQGVDGMEEPLDRVEDMAALYLESIKAFQPHGPYILIGYSFGGLVAVEMGRSLLEARESIALLAMVDAYYHPHNLAWGQYLRLIGRRGGRHISELRKRSTRGVISYLVRGVEHRLHVLARWVERRLRISGSDKGGKLPPGGSRLSFARTIPRVKEKAYEAFGCYEPQAYRGKIKFIKGEDDLYFPADPAAVWAKLAAEFEFETVAGGHLDMVTEDFLSLAAALTRFVNEANRQK
jgi:acetoacetyl-CoA synthetase